MLCGSAATACNNESMKCEAGTIVAAEKGEGSTMLVSVEVLLVNAAEMGLPACIAPPANANCRGRPIGIRGSIRSQVHVSLSNRPSERP